MSTLEFWRVPARCAGVKGPRAADWLAARGFTVPAAPNTWMPGGDALLVARLGSTEFFLEDASDGSRADRGRVQDVELEIQSAAAGVYPVMREDAAFALSGSGAHDVLAQVCNVNFADLELASRPVVMTLMIGVAVLVVPQAEMAVAPAEPRYRIWCDPTFGEYLGDSLRAVVGECGGNYRGETI